jgi:hypothetical protein
MLRFVILDPGLEGSGGLIWYEVERCGPAVKGAGGWQSRAKQKKVAVGWSCVAPSEKPIVFEESPGATCQSGVWGMIRSPVAAANGGRSGVGLLPDERVKKATTLDEWLGKPVLSNETGKC